MEPGRITPEEFLFEFETRFRTGFHLLSKDMRSEIEGDLRKIRRLLQERRRADERGDNSDDINDQMRELEASVRVAELVIDQSLSERELVVRFFLRIRRMSSPTRSEVGWSISDI
ncbi:hypothetical protein A2348_05615 [Candidatus Uhrbacteria bacterium RIFOXYB12_FULL_58_10]|uniref:Uncharacterized protein n=1 Tax=Candidatus Uhrbacteria bacterium RIFOXYB2_FULL_57_15 TaxID=1802422 RepID=A0A1F7W7U0_9BACT|nr:MAG: hypothetical protein A2348_05615 [Candidatus Uhrbacteria bacterium RIFOXYB12_FULL_58_10]OGL98862.1 MAG: hypothetical protein A2304_03880 [Candidatus Uhrbacteria bacterium RIFOXYB2_FULL_57_15]OGL99544.1 MAG: hypothetical protein A2501_04235 [Candidatus Uhrbacteria bacterium RIFOXYC12_FULL_57_11]